MTWLWPHVCASAINQSYFESQLVNSFRATDTFDLIKIVLEKKQGESKIVIMYSIAPWRPLVFIRQCLLCFPRGINLKEHATSLNKIPCPGRLVLQGIHFLRVRAGIVGEGMGTAELCWEKVTLCIGGGWCQSLLPSLLQPHGGAACSLPLWAQYEQKPSLLSLEPRREGSDHAQNYLWKKPDVSLPLPPLFIYFFFF